MHFCEDTFIKRLKLAQLVGQLGAILTWALPLELPWSCSSRRSAAALMAFTENMVIMAGLGTVGCKTFVPPRS